MTSMPSIYSTMAEFISLLDRSYFAKLSPLILNVSPMHKNDSGNVTSEASASRQSMHKSAAMLITGSTICPAPSGIMCASGGSIFSILSTIMFFISPMEWFSTSPSGARRKRSARRRRRPSSTEYAMAWDMPVERLKRSIFTAYAARASAHHFITAAVVAVPTAKRHIIRYMQ